MYKKGIQTRNLIYQSAKKIFYENGYKKARIQDITDMAGVPIGLFTYYFKSKDGIVQHFFSEFLTQISLHVNESVDIGTEHSIKRHALVSCIFFDIIFEDQNNRRFFYETIQKKSNYRILSKTVNKVYQHYLDDFNIEISDREFDDLLRIDFGARREFFLYYMEEGKQRSIGEIVHLINGIFPRLIRIDQAVIDKELKEGIALMDSVDYQNICLLQ